jgi:NAD(P)-dependent dehydrogenase (short-subunit alcohol dehydrogenase family)
VTTVQGDISNLDDLDRLYSTVKKEKGILHIVLANAAFVELAPPSTATPEHYDKSFSINARGTFSTIQKAVPLMTAGGAIVTVGSVAKKGLAPMTAYSSAKAAIRYSVKGWAADLIGKGIRVNNLSPGGIDTPIYRRPAQDQRRSGRHAGYVRQNDPVGSPRPAGGDGLGDFLPGLGRE